MRLNQTFLDILFPYKRKNLFSSNSSGASSKPSGERVFYGQKVARRYCFYAFVLFALQGIIALAGAADIVLPDLPSPIPFEYGRSIHLNLAVFWPLIGTMGMVYYFITYELKAEIFSPRVANWQFWLVFVSSLGLYGTLALRIGYGREYLDGLPVFYIAISLSIALGAYNLIRTLISNKTKVTPAAGVMTAGMLFLLALLVPNSLVYRNPVADEAVKFWVVHLWEEMAFELTTAGFIAAFFTASGLADKKDVERWLYLEASLSVATGFFGTGHHYYWIGFPAAWLLIGSIFSFFQLIPVAFLLQMTYKGLQKTKSWKRREKLTLWLLLSSMFYHVTGAALLGLIITVPWINLYMHGTYVTSGHAHLALFGSLGFLVLSGCYYILSRGTEPRVKEYKLGITGVVFLNLGLLIMSSALLVAGFIQSYFWRYIGLDFFEVKALLKPYLVSRVIGGSIFTAGDLLLSWLMLKVWWKTR